MAKRGAFINSIFVIFFLIILFSSSVFADCCITSSECYIPGIDDDCGDLIEGHDVNDNSSVGRSSYECEELAACDTGCAKDLNEQVLSVFRVQAAINNWEYADSGKGFNYGVKPGDCDTYFGEYESCVSQCEQNCICGSKVIGSDEYCGNYDQTYLNSAECLDSYQTKITVKFDFHVVTDENNEDIENARVVVDEVKYDDSDGFVELDDTVSGLTDSNGELRLTIEFEKARIPTEIHYIVTKSGYEQSDDEFYVTDLKDGSNVDVDRIKLRSSTICDIGDKRLVVINDCDHIQECARINNEYVWDTKLTPLNKSTYFSSPYNYVDQDCLNLNQQGFCDDSIWNPDIGEECVDGLNVDEYCGVGEKCENCKCIPILSSDCVNNLIVDSTELCDYSLFVQLYEDNNIGVSDNPDYSVLAPAFNMEYVTFSPGMNCTENCKIIYDSSCGNRKYEPGEECEFSDGTFTTLLDKPSQQRCSLTELCRKPNEPGACSCIVESYCGNGIIEAGEECDLNWDQSYNPQEPNVKCPGSLECGYTTCKCEDINCPKDIDSIHIDDFSYDLYEINISLRITECKDTNLTSLILIYYDSIDTKDSTIYGKISKLNIPIKSYNFSDSGVFELNFKKTGDESRFEYENENIPGVFLEFENNTDYYLYFQGEYKYPDYINNQKTKFISNSKQFTIGSTICKYYYDQYFCYQDKPYFCNKTTLVPIVDLPINNTYRNENETCRQYDERYKCYQFSGEKQNMTNCYEVPDTDMCNKYCNGFFGLYAMEESHENILEFPDILKLVYGFLEDIPNPYCLYDLLLNETYNGFCYLDYTKTSVNSMQDCRNIQSCYDYKSEQSCMVNSCLNDDLWNCTWRASENKFPETGVGTCYPSTSIMNPEPNYDCTVCNKNDVHNKLLGYCNKYTCKEYGPDDSCFYVPFNFLNDGVSIKGCQNIDQIGCHHLTDDDDINGSRDQCIGYDKTKADNIADYYKNMTIDNLSHKVLSYSFDRLNKGVCKFVNNECIKDADGDDIEDCENANDKDCFQDNMPPDTELYYIFQDEKFSFPFYVNRYLDLNIYKTDDKFGYQDIKVFWSEPLLHNESTLYELEYINDIDGWEDNYFDESDENLSKDNLEHVFFINKYINHSFINTNITNGAYVLFLQVYQDPNVNFTKCKNIIEKGIAEPFSVGLNTNSLEFKDYQIPFSFENKSLTKLAFLNVKNNVTRAKMIFEKKNIEGCEYSPVIENVYAVKYIYPEKSMNQINNTFSYTIDKYEDGFYSLYYYGKDGSSNVEEVEARHFYVDATPPTINTSYFINYSYNTSVLKDNGFLIEKQLIFYNDITDLPFNKVDCKADIFELGDNNTLKVPNGYSGMYYEDYRTYDFTGKEIFELDHRYKPVDDGVYFYNITCRDSVLNYQNSQIEEIKVRNDFLINTILPNSTISSLDDLEEITFSTGFKSTCKLFLKNSKPEGGFYTFEDFDDQEIIYVNEEGYTQNKLDHNFKFLNVTDAFNSYTNVNYNDDQQSLISDKFYIKCMINDSENDVVGFPIGWSADYVQFAVDKDPPIIDIYSEIYSNKMIEEQGNYWLYKPKLLVYGVDEKLTENRWKNWASNIKKLGAEVSYKKIQSDDYQQIYSTERFNDDYCPRNIRKIDTISDPIICLEKDDDIFTYQNLFNNTGFYKISLTSYDNLENQKDKEVIIKVDNIDYNFTLYFDNQSQAILENKKYEVKLVPTKDVKYIIENQDQSYNMTLLKFLLYDNEDHGVFKSINMKLDRDKGWFIGSVDFENDNAFMGRGLDGVELYFEIKAIDTHGIESEIITNPKNFSIDREPPKILELTTLFNSRQEIQFTGNDNIPYPLFYYEGKYFTNQDELYVTGRSEPDALIVFSDDKRFSGSLGTYDMSENKKDNVLEYKNIEIIKHGSIKENEVKINAIPNFDVEGKYLEFDKKRKSYGEYEKRYPVEYTYNVIDNGEFIYIALNETIDVDMNQTDKISFYDQMYPYENFIFKTSSISEGCNDIYIDLMDNNENKNFRFDDYNFKLCKDTVKPKVHEYYMSPKDGEASSIVNRDIYIEVSDIGIDKDSSGIVLDKISDYKPRLYKNGIEVSYDIKKIDGNNIIRISHDNTYQKTKGLIQMNLVVHDFAHNVLNHSWSFILDDRLPPEPRLTFDKESTYFRDHYFLTEKPNMINLEFNETLIGFSVLDRMSLNDIIIVVDEKIDVADYKYNISNISLISNNDNKVLMDITKTTKERSDSANFEKYIYIDTVNPQIEVINEDNFVIGQEYINKEFYEFEFNILNEIEIPKDIKLYLKDEITQIQSIYDVSVHNCEKYENEINCVYNFNISTIQNEERKYFYRFMVKDQAGNVGESTEKSIYVDRGIPDVNYKLKNYDNTRISNVNNSNVRYLLSPNNYTFDVYTSKVINMSTVYMKFIVTDSDTGIIYQDYIYNENIISQNDVGNSFSFVFDISDYADSVLLSSNNIIGNIDFEFYGEDVSRNFFKSIPSNYTPIEDEKLYLRATSAKRPSFEPDLLRYYDEKRGIEGILYKDYKDNPYPIFFYEGVYYTKAEPYLILSGYAQETDYQVSILNDDTGNLIDTFTTYQPEIYSLGENIGKIIDDGNMSGKNGSNYIVLNSNVNIFSLYDISLSDNLCVFIDEHDRTKYGKYKKGYKIFDTETVTGPSTKIIFEDELEGNVVLKKISISVGEDCINNPTYFELKLNLTQLPKRLDNLIIKTKDPFDQVKYYDFSRLRTDLSKPQVKSMSPYEDEVITDSKVKINITVCDNSPGILGGKDPLEKQQDGNKIDFFLIHSYSNITMNVINGYIENSYVDENQDYCYEIMGETNNLGIGRHKFFIEFKDFAHNTQSFNYSFNVDPYSSKIESFRLSNSNNQTYLHDSKYNIYFTKNNMPHFFINFTDMNILDMKEINLYKVNDNQEMTSSLIKSDNYLKLKENIGSFNCIKDVMKGKNYFDCNLKNFSFQRDIIYMLKFLVNKSIERNGYYAQIETSFKKYFVFDDVLLLDSIDYPGESNSENVKFSFETGEMFGLLPKVYFLSKDREFDLNYLDSKKPYFNFDLSLMNDSDPIFMQGDHTLYFRVYDHAGNGAEIEGSILIDDTPADMKITKIVSNPFKEEKTNIKVESGYERAYSDKLVKFKQNMLEIVGQVKNDSERGVMDSEKINFKLVKESGDVFEEFEINLCSDPLCDYSKDNVEGSKGYGCLCKRNGVFNITLTELNMPLDGDGKKELNTQILIKLYDKSHNSKNFKAFLLRDLKPPNKPRIRIR